MTRTLHPDRPVVQAAAVVTALEMIVGRYQSHSAKAALAGAQAGVEFARCRSDARRAELVEFVDELRLVESNACALGMDRTSLSMRGLQLVQSLLYSLLVDPPPAYAARLVDEAGRLAEQAYLVAA